MKHLKKKGRHRDRHGSTVVELALCLPVLMLLILGSMELTNGIYLQQTLTSCAHEGALYGTNYNVTEADITTRVDSLMSNLFDPSTYTMIVETENGQLYENAPSGDQYTVVVTATPQGFAKQISLTSIEARVTGIKP